MDVERAAFIDTGINKELLSVTFLLKRFTAIGAFKGKLLQVSLIGEESGTTNLASELTSSPGIIIDILIGGIADGTYNSFRGKVLTPVFDRLKRFAMLFKIVIQKFFVVIQLAFLNNRHCIDSQTAILFRDGIVRRGVTHISVNKKALELKKNFVQVFYKSKD
jgi:hypothetical protein